MLALEVELLTGVYRAASPDGSGAEWPPHPERVFSAFVQAWGDGGRDSIEREALAWLESLGAPWIEACAIGECAERDAPTVFVPPNDARGNELSVLPERRRRQARSFCATIPLDPRVRFRWRAEPIQRHRAALDALASRVASLGHSASLARFAFVGASEADDRRLWRPAPEGGVPLRVAHVGRLDRLEAWLHADERPSPGMTVRYLPPGQDPVAEPKQSVFGGVDDWFVFEEIGGVRPDVLAFARVAARIRAALMQMGPQPSPRIITGHAPDGGPLAEPHLAIVPLANVGWQHSTGDLLGFAAVLPRDISSEDRSAVVGALAAFAHVDRGGGAYARVHLFGDAVWSLERVAAPSRASLRPERWCGGGTLWASATPVVLDRFPDRGDPIEEAQLIAAACRNIGLPEPVEVEVHKHSAVTGAPSAYPSGGGRSGLAWSFPPSAKFVRRPRRHVVLRFGERVEGPVLLGAARFHGLGLCLPLDEGRLG